MRLETKQEKELEFIMFLEMQLGIKQSQVDLLYESGFSEAEDLIILNDQMIDSFPINEVTKKWLRVYKSWHDAQISKDAHINKYLEFTRRMLRQRPTSPSPRTPDERILLRSPTIDSVLVEELWKQSIAQT